MKKTSGILWGIALVAIGVILALNALANLIGKKLNKKLKGSTANVTKK